MSEATAATMSEATAVLARSSRRAFLKTAAATAAGLTIGFHWSGPLSRALADTSKDFAPNAFLRIAPDNSVTVIAKHLEMGQGTYTGLATIVAEELDADWAQIRVESAPADASNTPTCFRHDPRDRRQLGTWPIPGCSCARRAPRRAAMLVAAAAAEWNVPPASLTVERGVVRHAPSNRQATFGELAAKAASQPVPDKVPLKDPKDFKLIGQKLPRVDIPGKTNGTAQFTIDVTFPNMLVAVLQRPPLFGATVKSFDATATKAVPGVVEVLQVPRGVAVVAKSFWAAKLGRDALKVEWDDSKAEKRSTAAIMAEYRTLAEQPGKPARKDGDVAAALKGAAKLITATYEFPYLAHAPMEPLDAVVKLDADSCEIWCGDQFQTVDQANAAATAGLKPEQVKIHTLLAGGSFGRRANMGSDYIVEAVSVAKALGANGIPVKLQWTREDDIRGGLYRPLYLHRLEAALDKNGQLVGWQHRIVGQSIIAGTAFAAVMVKDGIDATSVEGAANLPYAVPNMSVELNTTETGVPVLWWRSVGSLPHRLRDRSLHRRARARGRQGSVRVPSGDARTSSAPRSGARARRPRQPAGAAPLPSARAAASPSHEAFGTYVAQVAEVTVAQNGQVKVDRVVCAVDCGTPINPDVITAQMEGGIGFGLGAALYGAITLKDGHVEQTNFDDYQVLRIDEMPKVEVHIVPSPEAPTGVGEPGVAPVGPAVANAVFAATGKRLRVLPFAVGGTV